MMRRIFPILIMLQMVLLLSSAAAEETETVKLIYFYTPSCHKCVEVKEEVLPEIGKRFGEALEIEYRDVGEPDNYMLLFSLKKDLSADEKSVFPVLYAGGKFLDKRDEAKLTTDGITAFLEDALGRRVAPVKMAQVSEIEAFFSKFNVSAIFAAGFLDGLNPCAFTVIVFFVSFLFAQGYEHKNIAVTGSAFILSVFVTYLLIGLGIFGSLYMLKGFKSAARLTSIGVGIFSITLGIISAYDAFRFRKDGSGDGMILKLPKYVKDRIHKTIGDGYRIKDGRGAGHIAALVVTALSVGFLVSLLESVCTGQLYLPAIVFMIKTAAHKLTAILYLLLYNAAFVIPLLVIFIFAMAGATSQAFAGFMKRHLFLIKILLACLFIVLGAGLVHAEEIKTSISVDTEARKNDPYYYNFGIVEEGDILKHKFHFKNESKETVNITQVNTSCACTISKVDIKKVAPGRRVPIEIQFDTAGYPGVKTRYIYVHTDFKANPITIFEIRADIRKK